MAAIEVKATKVIDGVEKAATIQFDFGKDLDEAIAKFGKEAVYGDFVASAKITAQAVMRRALEANKTQEEITALMATWKPGVKMERVVDPVAALLGRFSSMDETAQLDLLKKLQSLKGAKK